MRRPTAPEIPLDPAEARKAAHLLAVRWLSARELAEARVRAKLSERGFLPDTIDAVAADLRHGRAIDDRRAVGACARTLVAVKLRGRQRAQRELEAMGFPAPLAREALDEVLGEGAERALADRVLAARLRGRKVIRDAAAYRRLYGALIRRGFSHALVRDALKPFWKRGAPAVEADEG